MRALPAVLRTMQGSSLTPGSSAAHTQLVNAILKRHGLRDDVLLYKQVTGTFISLDGQRFADVGLPGITDIGGILGPGGRAVAIECKTGNAQLSAKQKRFRAKCEGLGVLYCVARRPEDSDVILGPPPEKPLSRQRKRRT